MLIAVIILLIVLLPSGAPARDESPGWMDKLKGLERVMVIDGAGVHNVGSLHLHVTNWGAFGSYAGTWYPTAEFPSAQWPANSGVEHLYIGGLWVGAKKNGIPVVSTAALQAEFRPTLEEHDRIYSSFEGAPGGVRLPGKADDDRDGIRDEDWLNGYDDDGDGLIDEDFAAVGKQMFSCWFTDDQPYAYQLYPEHTPLNLFVRQESYQWDDEKSCDFVGIEYKIKNNGLEDIEDLFLGFFADGDVGHRKRIPYWYDDCTGLWEGIVCAKRAGREFPMRVSIAYFWDDDGDMGEAGGYFGIMFLGHETDPLGKKAPKHVGITSYQNFSSGIPYVNGGRPTNDYQRYELMSKTRKGSKDEDAIDPSDKSMLMAVGPFKSLPPDSTVVLQVAFICGEGLEGMLKTAASAAMAYRGNLFDIDGDPMTGIEGRETPLYGPVEGIDPDSCDSDLEMHEAAKGEIVWVNADCREELALWADQTCSKGNATFRDYQTGVDGRERRINWLVDSAPPPPKMRLVPGDNKVTLLWDNFSETTPDVSTLEFDFEGYRIWRADGWTRPIGTSVLSGPGKSLWHLIEERDLVNGVVPDVDFMKPYGEGGWSYEPMERLDNKEEIIEMFKESLMYFPLDTVPCPPGLSDVECDTIEALARYDLGFEGGARYYKYVDKNVHNGMHYFYSVTAYDHLVLEGELVRPNHYGEPSTNFQYIVPLSDAQEADGFEEDEVYVVPNPATNTSMGPWRLEPNSGDPTGIKVEFRNLPKCPCTVNICSVAGDVVRTLYHDGAHGTLSWDLISKNGQDVTSGVYIFAIEPQDDRFPRTVGKFIVIR